MVDDVSRLSDELARDPASLVFVPLGEALRRQGQLDLAHRVAVRGLERHPHLADGHDLLARIAVDRGELERAFDEWDMVLRLSPTHVGAMKGLGYICYQQGRREDAERYLKMAADNGAEPEVSAALANVRRSDGAHTSVVEAATAAAEYSDDDPRRLFADLIGDHDQTALLLDAQGLVLAGIYVDSDARDVSQEVGAELSGVSDEAQRASKHLDLGDWRSIVVETEVAVIAMLPASSDNLVMLAASRATPLGLVRRLADRCVERARSWLGGRE